MNPEAEKKTASNTSEEVLDTALLQQYLELLGVSGLAASMATFKELIPGYFEALLSFIEQRDEKATRSQAHKIKGSCRSLGFTRLGEPMRFIEQEAWEWNEPEVKLDNWLVHFESDYAQAIDWLNQQKRQT